MFDESKPLLPLGKHVKSISELITLCIENFEENTKRRNLFKSLMSNLIEPITDLKINCDIWVDGSFLTEKVEPNDIDVVIQLKNYNLNLIQYNFLKVFMEVESHLDFKNKHDLDVYFSSQNKHDYWFDLFTHDRNNTPKGFILLNL